MAEPIFKLVENIGAMDPRLELTEEELMMPHILKKTKTERRETALLECSVTTMEEAEARVKEQSHAGDYYAKREAPARDSKKLNSIPLSISLVWRWDR